MMNARGGENKAARGATAASCLWPACKVFVVLLLRVRSRTLQRKTAIRLGVVPAPLRSHDDNEETSQATFLERSRSRSGLSGRNKNKTPLFEEDARFNVPASLGWGGGRTGLLYIWREVHKSETPLDDLTDFDLQRENTR
jgi:hypothetical protein